MVSGRFSAQYPFCLQRSAISSSVFPGAVKDYAFHQAAQSSSSFPGEWRNVIFRGGGSIEWEDTDHPGAFPEQRVAYKAVRHWPLRKPPDHLHRRDTHFLSHGNEAMEK